MKKIAYPIILVLLILNSCKTTELHSKQHKNSPKTEIPKYIFYFIGDGFGVNQALLAEIYLKAKEQKYGIEKLNMNKLPVQINYTTHAEDRIITGSAASGTALATGKKTSIGTISMNSKHTIPFKTVAEIVKDKGMKVGIITSVSLNHATPAVFYAHEARRYNYYDIVKQLTNSGLDYFAGGGFYLPEANTKDMMNITSSKNSEKVKKNKHQEILDLLKQNGYRYINTKQEFNQLNRNSGKTIAVAPRLTDGKSMPYVIDQNENDITLQEFTSKGIELLTNPNGFFMMIEGGKIDWACHANDAASTLHEVLQFDEAVNVALEFYNKYPKETLIIVCADHETGGMTIGTASQKYKIDVSLLSNQKVSGSRFSKIIDNYKNTSSGQWNFNDAFELLQQYFGFNTNKKLTLNDCEIERLSHAFEVTMQGTVKEEIENDCEFYTEYGSYNPFSTEACQIIAEKAGIAFTTYSHTAQPVPFRAIGVGAEFFTGYSDNAEIGEKLINLLK